jgi:hypothetical protein
LRTLPLASGRGVRLGRVDAAETMHRFALGLLEAADAAGDVGPMTRFLAEHAEELDEAAMVAISTVAVTFMALTTGVNVRTAAESIWKGVSD